MDIDSYYLQQAETSQLVELGKIIRNELKRRKGLLGVKIINDVEFAAPSVKIKQSKIIPSMPNVSKMKHKMVYLRPILYQDWSYLFDEYDNSDKKYYVYIHKDPRLNMPGNSILPKLGKHIPFYVGKGTGDRFKDLNRNQGHGKRIKEILNAGYTDESIPVQVATGLGERDAFVLESKLIYLFKTLYESNHGLLVNLDIGRRPIFDSEMPFVPGKAVLIRKKKHGEAGL
jgi:hypothetical protein